MKQIDFGEAPTIRKNVFLVDAFRGIDLSSAPASVDKTRSPDAPNMISDLMGKPVKRCGFGLCEHYDGRINGHWKIKGHEVVHAGNKFYIDKRQCWTGGNDKKSVGQIIGENLYIFDGLCALKCDGNDIYPISYDAYIPTVTISRNPVFENTVAGGTAFEEVNLIGRKWTERFTVTEAMQEATQFQLSFANLDLNPVKVLVLNNEGGFDEKKEGTDFSVNRETGIITFTVAPGKTPLTGEDNVYITASRDWGDYPDRINLCDKAIAYNFAGTQNRLFVAGSSSNKDYWCRADMPEYFPDLNYSSVGGENSSIIGYSVVDGLLATHISPAEDGRCVIMRKYSLTESNMETFPVTDVLQGEEAAAPRSFVYMDTEPLFLTKRGVYAITAADVDGNKYTQNRSYYINEALKEIDDIENCEAAKWQRYYIIAHDNRLFLMDTSQKSFSRGEPYSTFQYECYLWTGINARILWEDDEKNLCFGDNEGNICKFIQGVYHDYSESGNKTINAYWTIPDFSGSLFWRNKTVRAVAVQAAAFPQNKVVLEKCVDGIWSKVTEWGAKICYFAWSALNWAEWTWSGNSTYRTLSAKVKIKKFDKVGFRISCGDIDKAFGLYAFSLEYAESGRYKK